MTLHIVLLEPEIPPNTGNIVRTCAALGASLHLIEPLGFRIDEATVRRAGLDYWDKARVQTYRDLEDFFARAVDPDVPWYFTTKAARLYTEAAYGEDTWLMFGKETRGLPEDLIRAHPDRCVRIPMLPGIRSLNLSNAVALSAYETMRQRGFPGLEAEGPLGLR